MNTHFNAKLKVRFPWVGKEIHKNHSMLKKIIVFDKNPDPGLDKI